MSDGGAHELAPELTAWVESALGGSVVAARRTAVGGSRMTYLVDVARADATETVVLRSEGQGSFTGTELSLAREVTAYRALAATAVPVPSVLAERDDHTAVVLERIPGSHDLTTLDDDERAAVMADLVGVVATLHRVDPDTLDLPGFARPRTPEDHARLDIAMWQRLAEGVDDLEPLVAYCGRWLEVNAPRTVARTCFVQGDTGPGNFLVEHGRVAGIVDMEFSHVGDPMDDLAWLLMRMRAERDDDGIDDLFARYERESGIAVDEASVRYYRLAVDHRCAITTSLAVTRGGGARGFAPYLMVTHRYLDGLARRLGELTGVEAHVEVWAREPTARRPLYDQLLADVRAAVKAIADPDLRERTRNAQIFVHLLRAHDQYGADVAELDRRDRSVSLGEGIDDARLVALAAQAGEKGDLDVLAYLLRRQRRRDVLWESLLGPGR